MGRLLGGYHFLDNSHLGSQSPGRVITDVHKVVRIHSIFISPHKNVVKLGRGNQVSESEIM